MTKRELLEQVARKAHLTKRAAKEAVEVILKDGIEKAMTRFNKKTG